MSIAARTHRVECGVWRGPAECAVRCAACGVGPLCAHCECGGAINMDSLATDQSDRHSAGAWERSLTGRAASTRRYGRVCVHCVFGVCVCMVSHAMATGLCAAQTYLGTYAAPGPFAFP